MKQRFSSLDIQIITSELATALVGHRLSNLYDLSSRIFLLKFALPSSKHFLLIDSGFRCHLTQYSRETSPAPSSFITKLRKHLRTRRLTSVRQLGVDRVIDFEFSDGLYHLYLEFFAGGNVILTDKDKMILAVLRIVSAGEDGRRECRNGVSYEAAGRDMPGTVTRERVLQILAEGAAAPEEDTPPAKTKKGKFQKKKKGADTLKRTLGAKMPEFSPVLVEHVLLGVDMDSSMKADKAAKSEEVVGKVVKALHEAEDIVRRLTSNEGPKKGYIIAKQPKAASTAEAEDEPDEGTVEDKPKGVSFGNVETERKQRPEKIQEDGEAKGLVFDDFHPFMPRQFSNRPGIKTLEYEGFNNTVDTFFSSIESQKLESRLKEREEQAAKRLQSARSEHRKRVEALREVQDLNVRKAQAIEANTGRVEEAIGAVKTLIEQGMDWVALGRLIEAEQKRGNPMAELIKLPLKLYENTVTLRLYEADWDDEYSDDEDASEEEEEEEEEEEDSDVEDSETPSRKRPLAIDVNLSKSAYANATHYYGRKKTAAKKETKTLESSAKALKSTERKIAADLKRSLKTEKQVLRPVRKPLWFEKFLFFVSSDGYLVLGGRDAQQNEHLYKRHFRRGDVYVHADIHGAATVIVKNNPATPEAPIPPSSLQQAGQLSVCTSQAWDSKAVMGAWWVGFDQVSKTAPTGEYLTTGSFMVRGKKNFLPPAQLILGFGVLWKVDEESKKRHVRHRIEEERLDVEEKEAGERFAGGDREQAAEPDVPPQPPSPSPEVATKDERDDEDDDEDDEGEEDEEDEDEEDEEFPDVKPQSGDEDDENEALPDVGIGFGNGRESNTKAKELEAEEPLMLQEQNPSASRPRLSARQRRDLKKGRAVTSTPSTPAETTRSSTPNPSKPASNKPLPRGKRAKAKRAAQKYADQDEEDRAIALSLLGGATTTSLSPSDEPKETPDQRKQRLREQHKRKQAEGLASEARRHTQAQAGEEEEVEQDEILTTPLDALIPDPREDDVLLDAIPVCAPWGAMGRYKWRAKMQPGAQKKGKAIRGVWGGWLKEKGGMKGVERELVASWKEVEIVNCVGVGKVKVFGPPGAGKGGAEGKKKGNPAKQKKGKR